MRFGWSRKSDDSSFRMLLEVIFCFLTNRKWRLKSIKWQFMMSNGSHFLSLEKPKIRLWWGRENDVSSGRPALGTHFLPLVQPKMRIGWSRKSVISEGRISQNSFSASWPTQNATWLRSRERFKRAHGTRKLFWTSGLVQNAISMKSKKRWFKLSSWAIIGDSYPGSVR